MFGESDSESPRVPSPWDPFLASPSSLNVSDLDLSSSLASTPGFQSPLGIPKLVPELQQGNVEYKLKLISPSPARFARLVTQLKWRLLEGGGQSYYELGVTDDGLLIGLSRAHLEQSLETLEMMAGEIGASVIVVKEIEVPKDLVEINEKLAARHIDFETGEVVKRSRRDNLLPALDSGDTSTTTGTESDSEPQSTVDIFSMDSDVPIHTVSNTTMDLEISSVYKPRPMRARAPVTDHMQSGKHKGGKKKSKMLPNAFQALSTLSNPSLTSTPERDDDAPLTKQQTKAAWRRQARDRKREANKRNTEKSDALLAADALLMIPALDALHVSVDPSPNTASAVLSSSPLGNEITLETTPQNPVDEGPRLIVEALVVRKLSLEEAFLDFGGFGFEV